MKNKIAVIVTLFLGTVASAQTTPDSTKKAATAPVADTATAAATTTNLTTLTDASLHSAYIADPEALKGLKTEGLRPEHSFPVLGTYSASGTSTGDVTISLDPVNKGIVWVECLQQGKFKALMKKAPATYKIPAQKTEDGKTVAEGTLFLNPASKELTIVLGRSFNEADPASSLTIDSRQKTKAWQYTGVKTGASAVVTPTTQQ